MQLVFRKKFHHLLLNICCIIIQYAKYIYLYIFVFSVKKKYIYKYVYIYHIYMCIYMYVCMTKETFSKLFSLCTRNVFMFLICSINLISCARSCTPSFINCSHLLIFSLFCLSFPSILCRAEPGLNLFSVFCCLRSLKLLTLSSIGISIDKI